MLITPIPHSDPLFSIAFDHITVKLGYNELGYNELPLIVKIMESLVGFRYFVLLLSRL